MTIQPQELAVLELLTNGELRITTAEISKITGFDRRVISRIISSLIDKGAPIVAERNKPNNGYYLATNKSQLYRGTAQLESQAKEELRRVEKLRRADLHGWREKLMSSSDERVTA